ncbi:oxygenase MpaB family protein [Leptospira sp. GIMC2001]|uniref:oxygenase MpaB family protein n=1 Tax=Leptospira sp. GIMC2001 TaxID=1513297 RepID=UPI002349E95E|nr:oxygenase MpaB family protein [Leptospira sp. GIMC2001]WCL50124.1 oxygenase MpaB family protein [Leptospira sp. GIMC2001]
MKSRDWSIFRSQGDLIADQFLSKQLLGHPEQLDKAKELFDKLTQNNDVFASTNEFSEFLKITSHLPEWIDFDKITIAQSIFHKYGSFILLLLGFKSLPMAYTCGKGAEVLVHTGRLVEKDRALKPIIRRLVETTQFVVSVLEENGFSDKGSAIIVSQKVRLMHSSIRYFISKSGNWDLDLGIPINQQDMAGTLQSFSSLIVEGLNDLGVELSSEEKDAYVHLWRVVGHLIGVIPELNPDGYDNAYSLGMEIFLDQREESEAGKILTKSLIDFYNYMVPGNIFDEVPILLLHELMGAENCQILDVPPMRHAFFEDLVFKLGVKLDHEFSSRSGFQKVVGDFSKAMLVGMDHYYYDDKKAKFEIPPSLTTNWSL